MSVFTNYIQFNHNTAVIFGYVQDGFRERLLTLVT